MKRGRGRARASNGRKRGKHVAASAEEKSQSFGCPVEEIPRFIWFDILLMISVRGLLACRCVCKTWRDIIAETEFAKQYFAKSEVHALIRPLSNERHVSRSLYLVELGNHEHQYSSTSVDHFTSIKLETKLKFPLRNSDLEPKTESPVKESTKRKHPSKSSSATNRRFSVANSCRGFLCLFNPLKKEHVIVYNPITGEYINLPTRTRADEDPEHEVECALGFSSQANQYKVIRMFDRQDHRWARDPITGKTVCTGSVAEIHTLGTTSWRMIGDAPSPHDKLGCATYVDGAIHWLYFDERRANYIVSFDFGKEKFQPITPPVYENRGVDLLWGRNVTIAELRGCLCMCVTSLSEVSLWVMKEYGVQGSWTKEFRVTASPSFMWGCMSSYKPLCILSNKSLVLYQPAKRGLLCFGPNGEYIKFLKLCGLDSVYEAIQYTPSFMSLRDAVVGEDLEVLNINSRVAGFLLPGKKATLSLEERLLVWEIDD